MVFVRESIALAEDTQFGSYAEDMMGLQSTLPNPIVVDREQEIVFALSRSGHILGDDPGYSLFALLYKNQLCFFETHRFPATFNEDESECVLRCQIDKIKLPENFLGELKDLINIFKEAYTLYKVINFRRFDENNIVRPKVLHVVEDCT